MPHPLSFLPNLLGGERKQSGWVVYVHHWFLFKDPPLSIAVALGVELSFKSLILYFLFFCVSRFTIVPFIFKCCEYKDANIQNIKVCNPLKIIIHYKTMKLVWNDKKKSRYRCANTKMWYYYLSVQISFVCKNVCKIT